MFPRVPGDVDLQWHGPNRGTEVVEADVADAQPVGEVPGVGQGRREADDPQIAGRVRGDEVRTGDDDLQGENKKKTHQRDSPVIIPQRKMGENSK